MKKSKMGKGYLLDDNGMACYTNFMWVACHAMVHYTYYVTWHVICNMHPESMPKETR
jgi:hypothetical protein